MTDSCFKRKADDFVAQYLTGIKKDICVEALCFLKDKEECPKSGAIIEAIVSKVPVASSKKYISDDIREVILELITKIEIPRKAIRDKKHWGSLRAKIFALAKTL